jgi:hypothetical protein
LLGITALFSAAKYSETCIPDIKKFIFYTDNAFELHEMRKMERYILVDSTFNLPSPLHFLHRFGFVSNVKIFNLMFFLKVNLNS